MAVLEKTQEVQAAAIGLMASDVRAIRDAVLQARGGWRTMMLLGGSCGTLGVLLGKWAPALLAAIK